MAQKDCGRVLFIGPLYVPRHSRGTSIWVQMAGQGSQAAVGGSVRSVRGLNKTYLGSIIANRFLYFTILLATSDTIIFRL